MYFFRHRYYQYLLIGYKDIRDNESYYCSDKDCYNPSIRTTAKRITSLSLHWKHYLRWTYNTFLEAEKSKIAELLYSWRWTLPKTRQILSKNVAKSIRKKKKKEKEVVFWFRQQLSYPFHNTDASENFNFVKFAPVSNLTVFRYDHQNKFNRVISLHQDVNC